MIIYYVQLFIHKKKSNIYKTQITTTLLTMLKNNHLKIHTWTVSVCLCFKKPTKPLWKIKTTTVGIIKLDDFIDCNSIVRHCICKTNKQKHQSGFENIQKITVSFEL